MRGPFPPLPALDPKRLAAIARRLPPAKAGGHDGEASISNSHVSQRTLFATGENCGQQFRSSHKIISGKVGVCGNRKSKLISAQQLFGYHSVLHISNHEL